MGLKNKKSLKSIAVNFKSLWKDIVRLRIYLLLIVVKILIFGLVTETLVSPLRNFIFFACYLLAVLGSVLILTAVAFLFNNPGQKKIIVLLDALVSVIIFADIVYFRYFGEILSVSLLQLSFQLGEVKDSIFNLISVKDFWVFINLALMVPLVFLFRSSSAQNKEHGTEGVKTRLWKMLAVMTIGIYLCIPKAAAHPKLLLAGWENISVAKNIGILGFHQLDLVKTAAFKIIDERPGSVEEKRYLLDIAASRKRYAPVDAADKPEMNLIFIQLEALQNFVINKSVNGREITPNLNRLIRGSTYFENIFDQVGGGSTSDAEFLSLTSLYPFTNRSAFIHFPDNDYDSALPNILKKEGYQTAAFHGFRKNFWNREVIYAKLGFEDFISLEDFQLTCRDTHDTYFNSIGISDRVFYSKSFERLKTLQEPFFALLVSLSNHHPYTYLNVKNGLNLGDLSGSLIGDYLKTVHYTDKALGEFIHMLDQSGLLDRSLVVIYGDHKGIREPVEDGLVEFMGYESLDEYQDYSLREVPLVIRMPHKGSFPNLIGTYGGQIDIFPTVVGLMGLKAPDTALGKNLLTCEDGYAVFPDGSYIEPGYFYSAGEEEWFTTTGSPISEKDVLGKEILINSELQLSKRIILWNLYDGEIE